MSGRGRGRGKARRVRDGGDKKGAGYRMWGGGKGMEQQRSLGGVGRGLIHAGRGWQRQERQLRGSFLRVGELLGICISGTYGRWVWDRAR